MGKGKVEFNKVVIVKDLVYIYLVGKNGEGHKAITDIESFIKFKLSEYLWRCSKDGYVYTLVKGKQVYMARLITNNTGKNHTDHINNTDDPFADKLDNRASNLRIGTCQQNQQNARLKCTNTTGYKGVNLNKSQYSTHAKLKKHKYYFGGFNIKKYGEKAKLMAGLCYDLASEYLYGEFAAHNNVKEKGLLTEEEMKIVKEITFKNIEKHQLSKYEAVHKVELTNKYTGIKENKEVK